MDRGTEVLLTASIFTLLAGLFIILRCTSRFCIVKSPGAEDWLIILSLILSIATTVNYAIQRHNGLGRHVKDVTEEQSVRQLQLLYASIYTYNIGLFICKGSILYQYLRFFVQRSYRRAAYALMGIILFGGLAFIITHTFTCNPINTFWYVTRPGHCINKQIFWYSFSAFNLATDFTVWILPMPVLWALQLPRKQKMGLVLAFALGGFGCIVGILRLHGLYQASISKDLTYDNVGAATWSSVELNVAIMCACIPAMRPVISYLFPRLLSTTNANTPSNPFTSHSHSVAYYQKHGSDVELSQSRQPPASDSEESLNFDTATQEQDQGQNSIKVKTEWTVTTTGTEMMMEEAIPREHAK